MSMSFRFKEVSGVVSALEVRDPDGLASVESLYRALLALRGQLVKAVDIDVEGQAALELSVCELDGARVKPARQRAVLAELAARLAALEAPESAVQARPTPPRTPLRAA